MPTNLLKSYNQLLELLYLSMGRNLQSLRAVFDRDFVNGPEIIFNTWPVRPTPVDGMISMDRLFSHLTTVITDHSTRKRTFEAERSVRLHWIRHHLQVNVNNALIFQIPDENRVYILDQIERYVVILEPLRDVDQYYLLTAYHLEASQYRKILRKHQTRGVHI